MAKTFYLSATATPFSKKHSPSGFVAKDKWYNDYNGNKSTSNCICCHVFRRTKLLLVALCSLLVVQTSFGEKNRLNRESFGAQLLLSLYGCVKEEEINNRETELSTVFISSFFIAPNKWNKCPRTNAR